MILKLSGRPRPPPRRPPAASTTAASSVPSAPAACARGARRPGTPAGSAPRRARHAGRSRPRRARDPLDRVGDREPGHRAVGAGPNRVDHGREQLVGGERTRRVVHDDDLGIGRHCSQAGAHRGRAGRAADGRRRIAGPSHATLRGEHDDHAGGMTRRDVDRAVDEALGPEPLELLRPTEARAGAGRDDDRPGAHRSILPRRP